MSKDRPGYSGAIVDLIRIAPLGILVCVLSTQLGSCLGRIRRCGFIGGSVLLGMHLNVSKAHAKPSLSLSPSLPISLSPCLFSPRTVTPMGQGFHHNVVLSLRQKLEWTLSDSLSNTLKE